MTTKPTIGNAFNSIGTYLTQNKSPILFGIGLTSMISATILGILATKKVAPIIEEEKMEIFNDTNLVKCDICGEKVSTDDVITHIQDNHPEVYNELLNASGTENYSDEELAYYIEDNIWELYDHYISVKDAIRVSWKYYIFTFVTLALGSTCLIISNKDLVNKEAMMAMTINALQRNVDEYYSYRAINRKRIGNDKEKEVYDEAVKERLIECPKEDEAIYSTGLGNCLCFDKVGGKFFRCDYQLIERAVDELNSTLDRRARANMDSEDTVLLQEFYDRVQLPECYIGSYLGWRGYIDEQNRFKGSFELRHTSHMEVPTHEPVYVVDFDPPPRSIYG